MFSHRAIASRALLVILAAGAAWTAPADASEPIRYETSEALVWVEGTSSLHDWRVESTAMMDGRITVEDAFFSQPRTTGLAPEGHISVPARSLESGKKRMDSLMYQSLAADEHPTIEFHLASAAMMEPAAASLATVKVTGQLTIAGTTREVSFPLQVDRSVPGVMVMSGELPLKMTEFGIDPPRAMLGTLKTGDEVTVGFRWVVTTSDA